MSESTVVKSLFLAWERTQHCEICGYATQQEISQRGDEQWWWCTGRRNGKF